MAFHLRAAPARNLAVTVLLLTIAAVAPTGSARAGAATSLSVTRYASTSDHFSLSYPSAWMLDHVQSSDVGQVESSIAPMGIRIGAPDAQAFFVVFVRHSATSSAALKAKVIALLKEDATLVGGITFGTVTINGVKYLKGSAIDKISATEQALGYIVAASPGKRTYYAGAALGLKQTNTTDDNAELAGILASFKVT